MFKGNGFATCFSFLVCLCWGRGFCLGSFFAGSLFFDGQYGDVSNILQKHRKKPSLLLTVVIYLGHFRTLLAQLDFLSAVNSPYHVYFKKAR